MDGHVVDLDLVQRHVVVVHRLPLHQLQTIKPIYHSAEYCIRFVQLVLFGVRDEELALVAVWTAVRHRNHPPLIVLQCLYYLVFEWGTVNG